MDEITTNSAPPPLPSSLSSSYLSLTMEGRRLFNKVFMLMWSTLVPHGRRYGVLYSYWAIDSLRIRYGLSPSDLSLLAYLCMVSDRGKYIINSNQLKACHSLFHGKYYLLTKLTAFKDAGYIVRLSRDPSLPYLSRSISRQKIFIQFTGKGVELIDKIERELFKLTINTSLANVTTVQ